MSLFVRIRGKHDNFLALACETSPSTTRIKAYWRSIASDAEVSVWVTGLRARRMADRSAAWPGRVWSGEAEFCALAQCLLPLMFIAEYHCHS